MLEGLSFGWRTAVLSVAAVQLLILALALGRTLANRVANQTLAVLLGTMTAIFIPWLIGFAGFYDRWLWLTFAPFQITFAVAPLGWLYLCALTEGSWPKRGWRHLLPAFAQFTYLTICFLLPLDAKLAWSERSTPSYAVMNGLVLLGQIGWYAMASLKRLRAYRHLLGDHVADEHRFAVRWLGGAFAALGGLFAVWTAYLITDLFTPLGYGALMGLYLAIAGCALYLGIEGWRHAALGFPRLSDLAVEPAPEARDWVTQGRQWAQLIREKGWARDPDLTLASLARQLGTNTGYLSRAINTGLGTNFAGFIAGLRAEAVAARLDAGDRQDLLAIALDEGFGSKASFNRTFAAVLGQPPSSYRRKVSKAE